MEICLVDVSENSSMIFVRRLRRLITVIMNSGSGSDFTKGALDYVRGSKLRPKFSRKIEIRYGQLHVPDERFDRLGRDRLPAPLHRADLF